MAAVNVGDYVVVPDPDDPATQKSGFTSSGWDKCLGTALGRGPGLAQVVYIVYITEFIKTT